MAIDIRSIELPPLPEKPGVEYRHIPGYHGYAIGDDGGLLSAWKPVKKKRAALSYWREKRSWANRDRYRLCCVLDEEGKQKRFLLHTLVLLAFVGPRPKGYDCLHANGIPDDNRLSNLRWGTRKENMEDCRRHGRTTAGEKSASAKMSVLKARATRALHAAGWIYEDIAALFGVSEATISDTILAKRWKEQEQEK